MKSKSVIAIIAMICMFSAVTICSATRIGPGADIPDATGDDAGARLNVTRVATNLAAGTYEVVNAAFNMTGNGYTRPFLLKLTNTSPVAYETLWVGGQFSPGVNGLHTNSYLPSTERFTLAADTDVYAGIYYNGNARVLFNNVHTVTDHDSESITEPTAAGQTVSGFNYPGLNVRTYAYEINIEKVDPGAFTIGPGSGISDATGLDDYAQERLNVTRVPVNMTAGRYTVLRSSFNLSVHSNGVVRPFLLKLTSTSPVTYETLWVGSQFNDQLGSGIQTNTYSEGSEVFTLAADTEVYAGFYQNGRTRVYFNNIHTLTSHDASSITEPTAAGQTVTDFSYPELNIRTYAHEIDVQAYPYKGTVIIVE